MDITANGASHVNSTATSYHRWGELDDDEADISQEWAFPHSAPWCKTDNSWGSCSCYLTNNIRLWYGDTINRQIDFVLNRRCGPPGGLRLGSKFPSSIWLTSTFFTSPNAQYGEYVATGEFWNSRPMYRRTFSSSPTSGYTLALSGSAPDLASGETSWRLVRYSKAEGQRRMLTWPCRADIGQNLFCISAAAQVARIGTISIRLDAPPSVEVQCHVVTFETSSSHSWAKTAGSITVDGYGVLPSTCHDSTGASCDVNVCSSSLKVTTRTGDGWLFKVKVQGMDITANGASHVNSTATSYHRWGQLDDDEADISQEWAFPHSAPWCKTDNSWGSCSCYLTNNIRLWYGDTINRQIDFVLNRRCGPPGGLRLGSKFPSSIWLTSTFFTSPNAQYGEYVATGEFWNSRPMYRRTFSSSPTSGYTLALSGSAPDLASGETSWRLVRYSKAEGQRRMLTWPCRADIGQNLFCISAAAQIA